MAFSLLSLTELLSNLSNKINTMLETALQEMHSFQMQQWLDLRMNLQVGSTKE